MRITRTRYVLAAALLGLVVNATVAFAQEPTSAVCSTPVDLAAGTTGANTFPTIVADASGGLHVFWNERIPVEGGFEAWVDYAYWDGVQWSQPIDAFISTGWHIAAGADAVVDDSGIMHTVWIDVPKLMYAQRHVSSPVSARSWSGRVRLPVDEQGGIGPALIRLGAGGILHVVYTHGSAVVPGVYYLRSDDGGRHWERPVLLSDPSENWLDGTPYSNLDVIVDSQSLHVAWQDADNSIFYVQSRDAGKVWTDPVEAAPDGRSPTVFTLDNGRLALLSTGGVVGAEHICQKRESISPDGATWTEPRRILAPVAGCLATMDVLRDNDGGLHLVTSAYRYDVDAYVEKMWQSTWDGEGWSEPELLNWPGADWKSLGRQPDFPSAAISEGNILNVVFHVDEGHIWFMRCPLQSSRAELVTFPVPTVSAAATPTATRDDGQKPTQSRTATPEQEGYQTAPIGTLLGVPRGSSAAIVGAVASGLLVALVLVWKIATSSRR